MGTKVKLEHCVSIHFLGCCAILVFNLFTLVLANSNNKCATLYNANSYQGSPLSFADGDKQPSLRQMNFVPQSVKVTPGCFLTMFDIYGNKQTIENDMTNMGWSPYRVLDATCCECGGCNDAAIKLGNMCARLFENSRCDSCSGYRLDLRVGDEARRFGPLSKRMTSIAVREGCTLTVFYEPDFTGWRFNFTYSNNMLGGNWYKQISSAKCGCSTDYDFSVPAVTMTPIQPTTTRATITLPTTTKAIITLPTTTRATIITLPTATTTRFTTTTTTESSGSWEEPSSEEDWYPSSTTTTQPPPTTTRIKTTTTTKPTTTTRITTTTTKPTTTTRITTTTTEPSSSGSSYEEPEEPEEPSSEEDGWFGGAESSAELFPSSSTTTPPPPKITTTTTTTTTTTPASASYASDSFEITDYPVEKPEVESKEDEEKSEEDGEDEDDWSW